MVELCNASEAGLKKVLRTNSEKMDWRASALLKFFQYVERLVAKGGVLEKGGIRGGKRSMK